MKIYCPVIEAETECDCSDKCDAVTVPRVGELEKVMHEFTEEAKSFPSGSTEKDDWLNEWIQDFERILKTHL